MAGFQWSEREPGRQRLEVPVGDLWCVRDAFCQLMDWSPGSLEWDSFIEEPDGPDVYDLAEHLGLTWRDPRAPDHYQALLTELDHPAVFLWGLTIPTASGPGKLGHTAFERHAAVPRGLPLVYSPYHPELVAVFVDTRRPPKITGGTG